MKAAICSNQGYDKLERADILSRARKIEDGLSILLLYRSIWEGLPEKTLQDIKSSKSELLEEDRKDVSALEKKMNEQDLITDIRPFVFEHPYLIARMVFGSDMEKFASYGFGSKMALASAISTYCIAERDTIKQTPHEYSWRNNNYRNVVSLTTHGDMDVTQIKILGNPGEDVIIDPQYYGFGLQQDWSPFLASALKYAEAIGKKDIPQIRNWREFARQIRKHNFWGTKIPEESKDDDYFDAEIIFTRGLYPSNSPIFINDHVAASLKDNRLEMLRESADGKVLLYDGRLKMNVCATYFPDDLPHLLNANYQLFARSVDSMAKLMDYFNNQTSTSLKAP